MNGTQRPLEPPVELRFVAELRLFLAPANRAGTVRMATDGTSSLGHVVESAGVPLPEVGLLHVNDRPAQPSYRPRAGDRVRVEAVSRPQALPAPRFLLDVHLGALARRMRLVGVDTSYSNDLGDDALIDLANSARRVLLTKDRGLLRRRKLWLGAYVRGARPDEQLADVLDRFAPPLAPWTRCVACNGPLARVTKSEVEAQLLPGTRRTYDDFCRCADCGRVYWRGAHSRRLAAIVAAAARPARGTRPNATA
jgi:uncharacterized protein with PIN domain